MRTFSLSIATVVAVLGALSFPSIARADESIEATHVQDTPPPETDRRWPANVYYRFEIGPDARVSRHHFGAAGATLDSTFPSAGLELSSALGGAIAPRTALAGELSVFYQGASSDGPFTGLLGMRGIALLDHYLGSSRLGAHLTLGAGLEVDVMAASPDAKRTLNNAIGNETLFGPVVSGGIGYDWSPSFGVLARVDSGYLSSSEAKVVPLDVFVGVAFRRF
jgi:hypothetical protein